MRTIEAQSGQTLFDIAIQHCGTADAVFDIAELNGMRPTDIPKVGSTLEVPEVTAKKVVRRLAELGAVPATGRNITSDETSSNSNDMSKQTKEIDYNLASGNYTTDHVILDGSKATLGLYFESLTGGTLQVKLQQAIDAEDYEDIPNSTRNISAGARVAYFNVAMLPRDLCIRAVLTTSGNAGRLVRMKLLSNE